MVIYEVLGGQAPFARDSFLAVASKVLMGKRPERPQGAEGALFTDNIWQMLELCWKPQPRDRINAQGVLLVLIGNPCLPGPSPHASGDGEMDGYNRSDGTFGDSLDVSSVSSQIRDTQGKSRTQNATSRQQGQKETTKVVGTLMTMSFMIYDKSANRVNLNISCYAPML